MRLRPMPKLCHWEMPAVTIMLRLRDLVVLKLPPSPCRAAIRASSGQIPLQYAREPAGRCTGSSTTARQYDKKKYSCKCKMPLELLPQRGHQRLVDAILVAQSVTVADIAGH